MERYLSGERIARDELSAHLARLSRAGKVYPILSGSALLGQGIPPLLDAICDLLPAPDVTSEALCGAAFAVARDRLLGRGLWIRLYSGCLRNRSPISMPGRVDPLTGERAQVQAKITQIRGIDGADRGVLKAGEIGIVYGLGGLKPGQIVGDASLLPRRVRPGAFRTPVMTVQVTPDDPADLNALAQACFELSEEDPLLNARHSRESGEVHLEVMGAIQLEILQEELNNRFGLRASFSKPSVIYRETIASATVGVAEYTMPKPCWAILEFILTPLPRGSGVHYHSEVPGRQILDRYQHQVEQALPLALSQGRLGWQVTDVDIALVGGSHHQFHTHPLDFIVATPWAIQDGLAHAGSVLLEPIMELKLRVPQAYVGRIMSDVNAMRGEVVDVRAQDDVAAVTALVPAQSSMDYPLKLAQASAGRGSMSARLHSWRECPLELGRTAPRRGVDPLDTSRYILAARSALEGGIFDL